MAGFTPAQFNKLSSLFLTAFGQFTYETDRSKYGVEEYWEQITRTSPEVRTRMPLKGDCEAFAMLCMQKLINAGFNARLVVCRTERGEGHCICEVVSSDSQEAVYFDNRRTRVSQRRDLTGYTFLAVSPYNPVPGETRPWHAIIAQDRV